MVNLPVEEPDALVRARPDLWEPWVGNCPGPPGLRWVECPANLQRCQNSDKTSATWLQAQSAAADSM